MNIAENRSAFTVNVVEDNPSVAKHVHDALTSEGFVQTSSLKSDQFFETIVQEPPHIVFISKSTLERAGVNFLEKTQHSLPESSVVIYSNLDDHLDISRDLVEKVDDYLVFEASSPELLINSADRQALKSYRYYMNSSEELDRLSQWIEQFKTVGSIGESIESCMEELKLYCLPSNVLYFKFVDEHSSLVITHSTIDSQDLRGVGYKLYENEEEFSQEKLFAPYALKGLRNLLDEAVGITTYSAIPFVCAGVVEGIFVIESEEENSVGVYPRICVHTASLHVGVLGLNAKYEQTNSYDDVTRSLKKAEIIDALDREIVRASRIEMPMSFLLVKVEGVENGNFHEPEKDKILKYSARILQKHSRSSDIVGRFGENFFAVILPHTGKLGATIKAERIRRIFESANFAKVIPGAEDITVSVSVAAYPTHANTRGDLLEAAVEALGEVTQQGSNKVCLAKISPGFVSEFEIDESRF